MANQATALWLGSQISWVLIYFGLIVVVISALTYLLDHPSSLTEQTTSQVQNALNGLSLAGISLSGPLYRDWAVLRHRGWWQKSK